MAQRTVMIFTDDITGIEGKDVTTHSFSLDGTAYEIDLSSDSYQQLLDALGPFMGSGRKTGSLSRRRNGSKHAAPKRTQDAKQVREWAQAQGIVVSARGRIPSELMEQYEAAH